MALSQHPEAKNDFSGDPGAYRRLGTSFAVVIAGYAAMYMAFIHGKPPEPMVNQRPVPTRPIMQPVLVSTVSSDVKISDKPGNADITKPGNTDIDSKPKKASPKNRKSTKSSKSKFQADSKGTMLVENGDEKQGQETPAARANALVKQLEEGSGGSIKFYLTDAAIEDLNNHGPKEIGVYDDLRTMQALYVCMKDCRNDVQGVEWTLLSPNAVDDITEERRRFFNGNVKKAPHLVACTEKLNGAAKAAIAKARQRDLLMKNYPASATAELVITSAIYANWMNTALKPWLLEHPEMAEKKGLLITLDFQHGKYIIKSAQEDSSGYGSGGCKRIKE